MHSAHISRIRVVAYFECCVERYFFNGISLMVYFFLGIHALRSSENYG